MHTRHPGRTALSPIFGILLAATTLLAAVNQPATAQDRRIRVQPSVGLLASQALYSFEELIAGTRYDNSAITGASLGASAVIPLVPVADISLVAGVFFRMAGGATDFLHKQGEIIPETDVPELWTRTTWRLSYFGVPVQVRKVFSVGGIKTYAQFGAEVAAALTARVSPPFSCQSGCPKDEDFIDNISDTDFGLRFGIGAALPVQGRSVILEITFFRSMTDALDVPDATYDVKLQNQFVGLSLGTELSP